MQTLTITDTLKTLKDVETAFNLSPNANLNFFLEWQRELPSLTDDEKKNLDRIKASYLYNSAEGGLTEATINLLLVSPLLYLAGYCDPPFKIRAEKPVEITLEEQDKVYRGRLDILILKDKLWLAIFDYAFSTDYSIYGLPDNELYSVLQVMKKLNCQLGNSNHF